MATVALAEQPEHDAVTMTSMELELGRCKSRIVELEQALVSGDFGRTAIINLNGRGGILSWNSLLDERGQIVWKFERTLTYKIFGRDRARAIVWFVAGTRRREAAWMLIPITCATISTVGIFKLVSQALFLASVAVYMGWQTVTLSNLLDLAIALRVCLNSLNTIATLGFVIAGQISFGELTNWTIAESDGLPG